MAVAKMTDQQFKDARAAGKTYKQIAEEFGLNIRSVERRAARLARAGETDTKGAPGYMVVGESVLTDKDGNEVMRWTKTSTDKAKLEAVMNAAMEAFTEELPREKPVTRKRETESDLMVLYPVFDLHIGALAHKHECGENYDTATAEKIMNQYFDYSISAAPNAEKAVLLLGGDVIHSDGLTPVTPASGHVLDTDSRYAKLAYVALRATRRAVRKLLEKHEKVEVQILSGNHDESGMIWLRAAMAAVYEDEPRIYVDTSPAMMHRTLWGSSLIGFTHGHTQKKPETRLGVLATDYREEFGKSKYVYCHSGHWHHRTITEHALGVDEVHGQLGAKDAYSANGGWRSMRQASVIVYSKEFGEIGRFTARPEMFN